MKKGSSSSCGGNNEEEQNSVEIIETILELLLACPHAMTTPMNDNDNIIGRRRQ
jgi:hypothetical protein